jgi:peroxiredoxin
METPDWSKSPDWSKIPQPVDDGAARHLLGARIAPLALMATTGEMIDLSEERGLCVVYAYPKTGVPGVPSPPGWDLIPGARGCTPQSCSFRDHFAELRAHGVESLFGCSTQDHEYQLEAVRRLHLPFPLLSDANLELTHAMRLPTFQTAGMTLLKRFTLIVLDGTIEHVFYPVFPPDKNASDVLSWLSARDRGRAGSRINVQVKQMAEEK